MTLPQGVSLGPASLSDFPGLRAVADLVSLQHLCALGLHLLCALGLHLLAVVHLTHSLQVTAAKDLILGPLLTLETIFLWSFTHSQFQPLLVSC